MILEKKFVSSLLALGAGSIIGGIASYFFHFAMARMLTVEEYGLLYALIAITFLFTIPQETIRSSIARYSSQYMLENEKSKIKSLILSSIKNIFKYSIFVFIAFLLFLPVSAKILHAPCTSLIFLGIIILFAFICPVLLGALQGMGRFGKMSFADGSGTVIQALTAISLVLIGLRVNGALLAISIGLIASFIFSFIPLKDVMKEKKKPHKEKRQILRYSTAAFFIFLLLILIYTIDVVIARYFFASKISGYYSGISLIGKAMFFVSMAVNRTMFRFVSEEKKDRKERGKTLKNIFIITGAIVTFFLIITIVFPAGFTTFILGVKYIEIAPLLKYMIFAMAFLAFSCAIVYYNLSTNRHKKITFALLLFFVLIEIALLIMFHSTLKQFILTFLIVNAALFIALFIMSTTSEKKMRKLEEKRIEETKQEANKEIKQI